MKGKRGSHHRWRGAGWGGVYGEGAAQAVRPTGQGGVELKQLREAGNALRAERDALLAAQAHPPRSRCLFPRHPAITAGPGPGGAGGRGESMGRSALGSWRAVLVTALVTLPSCLLRVPLHRSGPARPDSRPGLQQPFPAKKHFGK